MIDDSLFQILECPGCHGALSQLGTGLTCADCGSCYEVRDGIPLFSRKPQGPDIELNREKWGGFWKNFDWERERASYESGNIPYIERLLEKPCGAEWFLEIGGGASYLCFYMGCRGFIPVSVDLDLAVLQMAKGNFARHGVTGHFVQASMAALPFKPGTFQASAGIGVLEHAEDLGRSVAELARALHADRGYTFQTVPYLSLFTLMNNSVRFGTVPRMPVLGSMVWLLHQRLLAGRFMRYGYEQSFTNRFLRTTFKRANFREVTVGFYDYNQTLFARNWLLGPVFRRIIRLRLRNLRPFADIAYVKAFR